MTKARRECTPLTFREFAAPLVWIDGRPLVDVIEPYRWRIFDAAFAFAQSAVLAFLLNLILAGRSKKNWKTADQVFAELYRLLLDSPGGSQVYHVANDEGQGRDALELTKKLIAVNPLLSDSLVIRKNIIERRDGKGFLEVLPGQDAIGSHGKTFCFLGIDEIHGQRTWDLLEALAMDPTRPDAQTWVTSYASIYHRPGVPLFDLTAIGKRGDDPRMLFSWYAADFTTDPDFQDATPEDRANPSRPSWPDPLYLEQQRRRLPSHKFRRLHLNLPGLPEGSAYQAEPVMNAVARGVAVRLREPHLEYRAFVDMSGGSSDDAALAIAHLDGDRAVLDRVVNQGPPPPFDPRPAVERFVDVLREYGLTSVTGDAYAGETFKSDFERHDVRYERADKPKSAMYEALEPRLNSGRVVLLDVGLLEQQLLGLVWRGGRIDHPAGEHDDWANAAAGVIDLLLAEKAHDGLGVLEWYRERATATLQELEAAKLRSHDECLEKGGKISIDLRGVCRACGCLVAPAQEGIDEENPWLAN